MLIKPISFLKKAAAGGGFTYTPVVTDDGSGTGEIRNDIRWNRIQTNGSIINYSSGEFLCTGASYDSYEVNDTFNADQYIKTDFPAIDSNTTGPPDMRLLLRCGTSTTDYYYLQVFLASMSLISRVSGSPTTLGTWSHGGFPLNDVILQAIGSSIKVIVGGTARIEVTNSDHTGSARPGIAHYHGSSASKFDNIEAGNVA